MSHINTVLSSLDEIYKKIDTSISSVFLGDYDFVCISTDTVIDSIVDFPYVGYCLLIKKEIDFFSSPRFWGDITNYYKENYSLYAMYWYQNLFETLQYLNEPEQVCEKELFMYNESDNFFIQDVLKQSELFGISYDLVKDLSIISSTQTTANYDFRKRTIYIHPDLKGLTKMYVLIHELMHHFHFSVCDQSIFISEYDYGAGVREGIVITMSEKIILAKYPFLYSEHINYLNLLKIRGKLSYELHTKGLTIDDFENELSRFGMGGDLAKKQYLSCFHYPGYKESYYPYYKYVSGLDDVLFGKLLLESNTFYLAKK